MYRPSPVPGHRGARLTSNIFEEALDLPVHWKVYDERMNKSDVRSDLPIEGMTCAACANRIQRKLSKLNGVSEAQVNFASGRATVIHTGDVDDAEFRSTIESLGYVAPIEADHDAAERRHEAELKRRWTVALVLGIPAALISMVPPPAFRWLAMGGSRTCDTGDLLVWLGLSPSGLDEPPARLDHDGHAGLDGNSRGLVVVDRCALVECR